MVDAKELAKMDPGFLRAELQSFDVKDGYEILSVWIGLGYLTVLLPHSHMLNIVRAVQSFQNEALANSLLLHGKVAEADDDGGVLDLSLTHQPSDSAKPTEIEMRIKQIQEMKFDLNPFRSTGIRNRLDRRAEWVT